MGCYFRISDLAELAARDSAPRPHRPSAAPINSVSAAAGAKDLGMYEVWLSNHVDLNRRIEPDPDAGVIRCSNGDLSSAPGNSCPDDDKNYYLD